MNSNTKTNSQTKKVWTTPQLTVHGTVEKITTQDKTIGGNDGIFLLGIGEIGDAS